MEAVTGDVLWKKVFFLKKIATAALKLMKICSLAFHEIKVKITKITKVKIILIQITPKLWPSCFGEKMF